MPNVHFTLWVFTGDHTVNLLDKKLHRALFSPWLTS